ncbi:hypothetical protein AB0G85_37590 [Streptomyces sioyaensis]|uniref:hypothetical protein n=1 Tax=Streptomyces sioyaensis TaxID=67364 RepID=UPI0033CD9BE3
MTEAVSHTVPLAELPPWRPPQPHDLPEWRSQVHEYLSTNIAAQALGQALASGHANLVPFVEGLNAPPETVAGLLLARSERARLEQAQLYYATADMSSLALAAAATPPTEEVTTARLPSPYGFMVFAEPIGGYSMQTKPGFRPGHGPDRGRVVGRWTPQSLTVPDGPVRWAHVRDKDVVAIPDDFEGIWLTFYSAENSTAYAAMDPDTVVGAGPDAAPITAGNLAAFRSPVPVPVPVNWDNETVYRIGHKLGAPQPDTVAEWGHVVYTAWQLIGQGGKRLIESEELPRPRSGRKRDTRQGITGPLDVQIVNVHSSHRPSPAAAQEDAQASSGRRAPQYTCRWPVRMHRRDHCMDPREHTSGTCTHQERIILPYVKDPGDKPLRVHERVRLWDHQPDQGKTEERGAPAQDRLINTPPRSSAALDFESRNSAPDW